MSALAKNIGISNDNTSVTKISAHARVDYILRFSKQAILVIDESVEQSNPISGQFLASLPEQHNAAYISLSAQFNNIQIRCRIIEQLYTGELFDPEISLAVSVINLAKKSQQPISIVLDNAQHLSLQVLHELSQLAAIAKKANLVVNIVLFGSVQAGKTVAENKSLFDNKLALLSAQSGQLLSTTSTIFKNTRSQWYFITQNKWLITALFILLSLGAMVIVLLQQDSFNFSQSIIASKQEQISLTNELSKPQTMVLSREREISADLPESTTLIATKVISNEAAIPKDIYFSLINPLAEQVIKPVVLPASPADIISAMTAENLSTMTADDISAMTADNTMTTSINDATALTSQTKVPVLATPNNAGSQLMVNNDYYANNVGYVIQIAAFRELKLTKTFLDTLTMIDYQVYQRLLNNKPLLVITSTVFTDKLAAESALLALPKSLLERQPWVKPITVINNEINAFLHSQ